MQFRAISCGWSALPLTPLALLEQRSAQRAARRHTCRVIGVAVTRLFLRGAQLALERLVEEGLALPLQAERRNAPELDLLPPLRRHQDLGCAERRVEPRDELPVLAARSGGVCAAVERHRQLLRRAEALVEVAALARRVLGRQRQVGSALGLRRRFELLHVAAQGLGHQREGALFDRLRHALGLHHQQVVLVVAEVRHERQRGEYGRLGQVGQHLVEEDLLALAHPARRARLEREHDQVGVARCAARLGARRHELAQRGIRQATHQLEKERHEGLAHALGGELRRAVLAQGAAVHGVDEGHVLSACRCSVLGLSVRERKAEELAAGGNFFCDCSFF